ncbi:unnamed protein product, partial [Amoebophrya sp. A25]
LISIPWYPLEVDFQWRKIFESILSLKHLDMGVGKSSSASPASASASGHANSKNQLEDDKSKPLNFGHALLSEYSFPPAYRNLNHGSW